MAAPAAAAWVASLIACGSGCPTVISSTIRRAARSARPQRSAHRARSSLGAPTRTATISVPVALNGFFKKDFATTPVACAQLITAASAVKSASHLATIRAAVWLPLPAIQPRALAVASATATGFLSTASGISRVQTVPAAFASRHPNRRPFSMTRSPRRAARAHPPQPPRRPQRPARTVATGSGTAVTIRTGGTRRCPARAVATALHQTRSASVRQRAFSASPRPPARMAWQPRHMGHTQRRLEAAARPARQRQRRAAQHTVAVV
jgi:hypothetical protein